MILKNIYTPANTSISGFSLKMQDLKHKSRDSVLEMNWPELPQDYFEWNFFFQGSIKYDLTQSQTEVGSMKCSF